MTTRLTLKQWYALIKASEEQGLSSKEYEFLLKRGLITKNCNLTEKGKGILASIPK